MKSLRSFAVLVTLALLMAFVPAASAQTASVATVQGKYQFQFTGVSNPYGYWSPAQCTNNCTFIPITNGAQCPTNYNCGNNPSSKFTFGYFEADGSGKITYLAFSGYNPGSSQPNQSGTGFGTYVVAAGGYGTLNLVIEGVTAGGCTVAAPCKQQIVFYFDVAQVQPLNTSGNAPNVAMSLLIHGYPSGGNNGGDTSSGFAFHQ